jgi:hypothetical protein
LSLVQVAVLAAYRCARPTEVALLPHTVYNRQCLQGEQVQAIEEAERCWIAGEAWEAQAKEMF